MKGLVDIGFPVRDQGPANARRRSPLAKEGGRAHRCDSRFRRNRDLFDSRVEPKVGVVRAQQCWARRPIMETRGSWIPGPTLALAQGQRRVQIESLTAIVADPSQPLGGPMPGKIQRGRGLDLEILAQLGTISSGLPMMSLGDPIKTDHRRPHQPIGPHQLSPIVGHHTMKSPVRGSSAKASTTWINRRVRR